MRTSSRLTFDRRVPEPFVELLAPGGPLHWIVDLALDWPRGRPTDIGLRAGPVRMTLYVGTTKAVDVEFRESDGFVRFLKHAESFPDVEPAFERAWATWQSPKSLGSIRNTLEKHLKSAIACAPEGRMLEGRYQALLGRGTDQTFVVADREVELSQKKPGAAKFVAEHQRDLRAIAGISPNPGDKLDAMAIGVGNQLFVIEVKPGHADLLGRTPLQVAMYQRLIMGWRDDNEPHAIAVLNTMVEQRARIGLAEDTDLRLRTGFSIVPVIAVGLPYSTRSKIPERIDEMRNQINATTAELQALQIWTIGGVTRLPGPSLLGR